MNKWIRVCGTLGLAAGALGLANFAGAAKMDVSLPREISVWEKLQAPVPGWEVGLAPVKHVLSGITVYDGKPAEKASLVPDHQSRRETLTWSFPDKKTRDIWIECRYQGTSVVLAKALPKNMRTFWVNYQLGVTIDGNPAIKDAAYE